eukprot:scaffold21.g2110.t1
MQGLRSFVQDENSIAVLQRGVKGGLAEGGPLRAGKGTPGLGLASARKALGNITNRAAPDAENTLPGKTPAAGAAPRRALGDITNANTSLEAQAPRAGPADKPAAAEPSCRRAEPVGATTAVGSCWAEEYAVDGVERLAGRGWEALERDRTARQDDEISARLGALASFSARSMPSFFPLWDAGLDSLWQPGQLRKDAVPSLPPSPVALARRGGGLAVLADADLGQPLELPDVGLDVDLAAFEDGL